MRTADARLAAASASVSGPAHDVRAALPRRCRPAAAGTLRSLCGQRPNEMWRMRPRARRPRMRVRAGRAAESAPQPRCMRRGSGSQPLGARTGMSFVVGTGWARAMQGRRESRYETYRDDRGRRSVRAQHGPATQGLISVRAPTRECVRGSASGRRRGSAPMVLHSRRIGGCSGGFRDRSRTRRA